MYDLNYSELSTLHQETIRRQAAATRLLNCCRPHRLSLAARALPALGEMLIQIGQWLKETPHRLEAEQASISSLTITL